MVVVVVEAAEVYGDVVSVIQPVVADTDVSFTAAEMPLSDLFPLRDSLFGEDVSTAVRIRGTNTSRRIKGILILFEMFFIILNALPVIYAALSGNGQLHTSMILSHSGQKVK